MPDFSCEDRALADGFCLIAGVDEAGRGPWAGPVVAGAVVLSRIDVPGALLAGLDDSKKLTAKRRLSLFHGLSDWEGAAIGIGIASREEIDDINILQATFLAMRRAVANLPNQPDFVLVDGNQMPGLSVPTKTVKKGDGISLSIAAASIVAKVSRDEIMQDLALAHPGYGWERNAGYGTAEHRAALDHMGVSPHHRRSFQPVRARLVDNDADGG